MYLHKVCFVPERMHLYSETFASLGWFVMNVLGFTKAEFLNDLWCVPMQSFST